MQVLFVTPEADPFVKTGGLGEVSGSLPRALKKLGVDVRIFLPKYSQIPLSSEHGIEPLAQFQVPLAWRKLYCGLEMTVVQNIPYYFIDNEYYFKRTGIYGFYDQAEQYAFFSRAVLESLNYLPDFNPSIIHCNDWHTALIPLMLKFFFNENPRYEKIRTVFTIHNLQYQGVFSREVLGDILSLGPEFFKTDSLEFHGAVNFMKAGLIYADRVTTVSPTYAEEIQTPYYGEKLEGLLQKRSETLLGILNGIDPEKYNPNQETLPEIENLSQTGETVQTKEHFPIEGVQADSRFFDKKAYKQHLQCLMGLPLRSEVPLLAIVSRLVDQKGLDLVAHVLDEILNLDVQMVVLGSGQPRYEAMFQAFANKYPSKLIVCLGFDEALARKIYAGSDIFLMPSRFEPCGIAQLIAMRYGSLPIVRETGGLKDTVQPVEEESGKGTGFRFYAYNAHELLFTIQRAVSLFQQNPELWDKIRDNAQKADFSWERSALQYLNVYETLTSDLLGRSYLG